MCDSLGEIDKLIEELYSEIKTFENVDKLYDYLNDEEANRWEFYDETYQKFVLEVGQHTSRQ